MGDLISRAELMAEIKQFAKDIARENGGVDHVTYAIKEVFDMAKNALSIDAEPVRYGRWVHLGGDEWCCSECGEVIHTEGSWEKPTKKYCHECGAKML